MAFPDNIKTISFKTRMSYDENLNFLQGIISVKIELQILFINKQERNSCKIRTYQSFVKHYHSEGVYEF